MSVEVWLPTSINTNATLSCLIILFLVGNFNSQPLRVKSRLETPLGIYSNTSPHPLHTAAI